MALAGCNLVFPRPEDNATVEDAPPLEDGPLPDGPESLCFGADLVRICLNSEPAASFVIQPGEQTVNTTSATSCVSYSTAVDAEDPDACVIAAKEITILGTLRARGDRSLVLVASSRITIAGEIDASSTFAVQGASPMILNGDCETGIPGSNAGGAGGSFGTRGGNGGSNFGGSAQGASAGMPTVPTRLRGGCPGGDGNPAMSGRVFGNGGGAVAVLSKTITIAGTINVSGGGARGGRSVFDGGGGGGSGGMILLDGEAVTVDSSGALFANGGGGGEGADSTQGGKDGGESANPTTAARGGGVIGGGSGGDGGDGSTSANGENGDPAMAGAAGGGGGGGGGYIHSRTAITGGGQISPAPR